MNDTSIYFFTYVQHPHPLVGYAGVDKAGVPGICRLMKTGVFVYLHKNIFSNIKFYKHVKTKKTHVTTGFWLWSSIFVK